MDSESKRIIRDELLKIMGISYDDLTEKQAKWLDETAIAGMIGENGVFIPAIRGNLERLKGE